MEALNKLTSSPRVKLHIKYQHVKCKKLYCQCSDKSFNKINIDLTVHFTKAEKKKGIQREGETKYKQNPPSNTIL